MSPSRICPQLIPAQKAELESLPHFINLKKVFIASFGLEILATIASSKRLK
jgi:hypothetical protein